MARVHRTCNGVNVTVQLRGPNVRTDIKISLQEKRHCLLKFGQGNAKLAPWVTTFSLPAGHSCPFAKDCRSSADRETGRITDGPDTEFRCYKASEEARYRTSRESGWHNFDLLRERKTTGELADLILASLPLGTPFVRIHTGGDFFSQRVRRVAT